MGGPSSSSSLEEMWDRKSQEEAGSREATWREKERRWKRTGATKKGRKRKGTVGCVSFLPSRPLLDAFWGWDNNTTTTKKNSPSEARERESISLRLNKKRRGSQWSTPTFPDDGLDPGTIKSGRESRSRLSFAPPPSKQKLRFC